MEPQLPIFKANTLPVVLSLTSPTSKADMRGCAEVFNRLWEALGRGGTRAVVSITGWHGLCSKVREADTLNPSADTDAAAPSTEGMSQAHFSLCSCCR